MKQRKKAGRVYRGGGWGNDISICYVADRDSFSPSITGSFVGFRCARIQHLDSSQLFCGGSHGGTARCRSSYRNNESRDIASRYLGFRCMRRRE
jgi:formylglycine-generating enzyme required for sulfatase activity